MSFITLFITIINVAILAAAGAKIWLRLNRYEAAIKSGQVGQVAYAVGHLRIIMAVGLLAHCFALMPSIRRRK